MNYETKYKQALEKASKLRVQNPFDTVGQMVEYIFPELKESKNERIRNWLIGYFHQYKEDGMEKYANGLKVESILAWLEKQGEPEDKGEISDGYHTFNELYRYRMLYNAAFFNLLPKQLVHKSKKHHDGKECFGGGWFIVMANLPTGQISNHYELKDWDLFHIPEKDVADEWDGHTPQEAAERLHKYLLEKQDKKLDPNKVIEWLGKCSTELMQALAFALRWCDEHPHWISVEDELPKERGWYLIYSNMGYDVCMWHGERWGNCYKVTHWMELPALPKKENK